MSAVTVPTCPYMSKVMRRPDGGWGCIKETVCQVTAAACCSTPYCRNEEEYKEQVPTQLKYCSTAVLVTS